MNQKLRKHKQAEEDLEGLKCLQIKHIDNAYRFRRYERLIFVKEQELKRMENVKN